MAIANALKHNYLFRGLEGDQLARMEDFSCEEEFDGGEVILRQFEKGNDLMILTEGNARIKTFSGDTIAEVGVGSVIGEVSLIDEQTRSATVLSNGPVRVVRIDGQRLRAAMAADPVLRAQLIENLAKLLCQRLRTANIQLDAAMAGSEGARSLAGR